MAPLLLLKQSVLIVFVVGGRTLFVLRHTHTHTHCVSGDSTIYIYIYIAKAYNCEQRDAVKIHDRAKRL